MGRNIFVAKRMEGLSYAVREVVAEAKKLEKQGKKILYLNIGDPLKYDFRTPKHLLDAVKNNKASYADSLGLEEAKQAIAKEWFRKGVKVGPDDILITTGGTEAIIFSIATLISPGDNILSPAPDYPLYSFYTKFFGGEVNPYYLNEENDWQPDVEDIRKKVNDRTRAVVIINPNNPTGGVYTKKFLKDIIDIAAENNLVIISDETYDKLLFDDLKHVAIASLSDEVPVVTFNTMSKNYLVPGWRIGWASFHDPKKMMQDYVEANRKLARARLSASHPYQYAIKPALEGPQEHIKDTVKRLQQRRDLTYKRLNEINGLSCVKPRGAFYAFPRIDLPVKSDKKFVMDLLHEENVLFVHGSGFGQRPGTHHFRTVFLAQPEMLEDAFERLERFIKKNYQS